MTDTAASAGRSCPYCRFPLKQGAPMRACPACHAVHHEDCWNDNGGCAVMGCTAAPTPGPRTVTTKPVGAAPPPPPPPSPAPPRNARALILAGIVALVATGGLVVALSGGADEPASTASPAPTVTAAAPKPPPQPSPASDGSTVTVYSSFPLQGAARPQAMDVIRGIKLAVRDHGGEAGGHPIRYVSLDDSTAAEGRWDARQTKSNAHEAAADDSAIAYIGEFNSGATANSLPILNQAGILQVSPSNTARGLTQDGPGAEPGEPEKYYPTGRRTYGRIVAQDDVQARALLVMMSDDGIDRLYVLDDDEVYGAGVAELASDAAPGQGIEVVGTDSWDGTATNYRSLAGRIRASGADAVLTAGIIDNNAPQLVKDIHRAAPELEIYAPDGMATDDFTQELPAGAQARIQLTAPTLAPEDLPVAGQDFYERYEAEYGEGADEIDPYAIYGYEAASVVLDAIDKGGNDRDAVVDAFFATRNRSSPVGTYSIDASGDTTLSRYGAYTAQDGQLVYDHAVDTD